MATGVGSHGLLVDARDVCTWGTRTRGYGVACIVGGGGGGGI